MAKAAVHKTAAKIRSPTVESVGISCISWSPGSVMTVLTDESLNVKPRTMKKLPLASAVVPWAMTHGSEFKAAVRLAATVLADCPAMVVIVTVQVEENPWTVTLTVPP
jgi:hypothetical protein